MLNGLMMDTQLTVNSIRDFASQVHAASELVSVTGDGGVQHFSYAESFARAGQLANALLQAGILAGDRVATLAWNDHRHFELYYGISGLGAVCHTINPRLFPEQIQYIINHAEDRLLFVDPQFLPLLEKLADNLAGVEQIILLSDDAHMPDSSIPGLVSYESFIGAHSAAVPWPELDECSASSLCYTSGTTGNPKGVLYSHRSTVLHAYAGALPDSLNLSGRDVVMPIVPMFHVNAWGIPYSAAMVGAKLVLPGARMGDGKALYQLIESEGVTVSAGVPTVWLALLAYLQESGQTLTRLQRIIVGGAACPVSIMEDFRERHGVQVIHAWGMTETSPLGTINTPRSASEAEPGPLRDKLQALQGRPVFGVDLRIVAADGNLQPWDDKAAGEVQVRGPWICSGYFGLESATSHTTDGWFKTGDIATLSPAGIMHITDRVKDVIKSGGEWISSIDLENAAVGHPAIREAAVIGVPHPKWTERPLLIAVLEAGKNVSAADLLAWLEGRIARWWIPADVQFVAELPHTATGKLNKVALREQFKDYSLPPE